MNANQTPDKPAMFEPPSEAAVQCSEVLAALRRNAEDRRHLLQDLAFKTPPGDDRVAYFNRAQSMDDMVEVIRAVEKERAAKRLSYATPEQNRPELACQRQPALA